MKDGIKLYCKLDQAIKDDEGLTYPEKCVIAYLQEQDKALPMIEIQDRFWCKWGEMDKVGKSLESKGKIKRFRDKKRIIFELLEQEHDNKEKNGTNKGN
jgi:DNA-binding MarR family transcriptional regulator